MISATRYHDISCGHRVVGHESKCALLHGHNYRVHFTCDAVALDQVGRVLDFSAIKSRLCMWLEENWDHKFLAYRDDPVMTAVVKALDHDSWPERSVTPERGEHFDTFCRGIVWVPFNPTAENMAKHLLYQVGPAQLQDLPVRLLRVNIEETRKCSADATLPF